MLAVFVSGVVYWGFRLRKSSDTMETSFLAGRKVPGIIASLSTVATNLNVNDFIGGAGMAYTFGVIYVANAMIPNGLALLMVALFIIPKMRRISVYTLGEWLEKRYCPFIGISYSVIWSFIWMLFNLGLYIYGGAFVLHSLVGWNLYGSIVLLSIIAAVYTLMGGFGAVVATDVLQIFFMFFPFIFISIAAWSEIGGFAGLAETLPAEKSYVFSNETPFGNFFIMIIGAVLMGASYWSTEAQVVQRPLSTPDEENAAVSYIGASFWLSILLPFLVSVPALAAIHFYPGIENPDYAMPNLIQRYLPSGLYGLTIVGLVAGFFSSADSQINAFCTMFTSAIYKRLIRAEASEQHYVKISKISGVIFTLAAIGTAVIFSFAKEGMMLFAISILATIMPPFGAVTLAGAVIRSVNSKGGTIGLITGMGLALALAVLSNIGMLEMIAEQTLYFRGMVTFSVTFLVTYITSILTGGRDRQRWTKMDIAAKWSPRIITSALLLLAAMAVVYSVWISYFV